MISRVSCSKESHYINSDTRLELHGEFVLVNCDLFNQLPDKRIIVLDQGSGLLLLQCAHVGDAFLQFIPTEVLDLSLG